MTCDAARAELGGYVLDGLTPDEAAALEDHLAACAGCRNEYEQLRTLPDLLALAGHAPPPPPAELRDLVLLDAAADRLAVRRRVRRNRVLQLVAALMAGVVLGGGAVWFLRSPPPRSVVTVALDAGSDFDTRGSMELHPTDNGVRIRLVLEELPPLDGDQVYETWLAPPGTAPLSIGTFRPDADGTADVTLWAAGPVQRYESMWVTLEPDFTDPAHDGPTVVAGWLP